MAITVKIGKKPQNTFRLNIRKSLDGNFIIFDHPDIDVVIMPGKKKILVLTNDSLNSSEKTYDIQNNFFKFMVKKGVVKPESIHAGNVYGSMEGTYPELQEDSANGSTATDFVLLACSKWMEQEKPEWIYAKDREENEIDRLTDPPSDETTPLGKISHASRKGTNYPLNQGWK